MEVLKIDETGSVLIKAKDLEVWLDIFEGSDGEVTADWNKYIFMLDNPLDMKIKAFQEGIDNYREASELAIDYYERLNR